MRSIKAFTVIEMLIVVAILCILMSLVFSASKSSVGFFGGIYSHYSEGQRSGVVIKISRKGVLFKSWEGEMNLGAAGVDTNGVMVPHTWEFSVRNPEIEQEIEDAANAGKRCTLKYHQYLVKPFSISTEYVIDEVETNK